jgi:O-acetyl-ADP-ribose deacetylase (regulator of RNase III)
MGGAVITGAGRLKARFVIHAVGPIYLGDEERDADLLGSAYRASLRLAKEYGLRSVSFPSISTGAFGYPMKLAAPVALRAICDFLRTEQHALELVRMVLYPDENARAYAIYEAALKTLLAVQTQPATASTGWEQSGAAS